MRARCRRLFTSVFVAAAGASALAAEPDTSPKSGFGVHGPAPQYSDYVDHSLYLPMRDGVRLAVLIRRPAQNGAAAPGRFPVIWHHSLSITQESGDGTGPRAGGFRSIPDLTAHGYVIAQVARRGNGQSFGVRRGYHDRHETLDAYEVTEWLAGQPWSSGAVGMYGCSNTGDAAVQAMTVRPPHLKAVFAGCFSWNKYDAMRRGGILAQWGTGPQRTVEQDLALEPVDGDAAKTLLRQAAEEHQKSFPLLELWRSLPFRDSYSMAVASRFWTEGSVSAYADQMRHSGAALYIQGGWRDEFRDQGLIAFANLPGSRIVIGPWLHCYNDGFALAQEAHRFFDQQLKGVETGILSDAPIHYYTINAPKGWEWRSAWQWPLARQEPVAFHLGGNSLARTPTKTATARSLMVGRAPPCAGQELGSRAQPCHAPGWAPPSPGRG